MKQYFASWIFALALLGAFSMPPIANAAEVTYNTDGSDFSNPERGFYVTHYWYFGSGQKTDITWNNLEWSKNNNAAGERNITLVRRIYVLDPYPFQQWLPQAVLDRVNWDAQNARNLGVKLIPRFAYNWSMRGQDASKDIVLGHLEQLRPVLQDNADVIAYMEAGFVGSWGEWHNSVSGLTDGGDQNATGAMGEILRKLLSVLPAQRSVGVRYPGYTRQIFSTSNPLNADQAFSGSDWSRAGMYDDCLGIDAWDGGTFNKGWTSGLREYLAIQSQYTPVWGESCGWNSSYASCGPVMDAMRRYHWSALHAEYEQQTIGNWISGGCIDPLKLGLGYRYRLTRASLPSSAGQGGQLSLDLSLVNDGFAAAVNARGLEIILRPTGQSGAGRALVVTPSRADNTDARHWQPGLTHNIQIRALVPNDLAPGSYDLLLHLPDPMPRLYGKPAYSIRLANPNVWESGTGYNRLFQTIQITTGVPSNSPVPTRTITPSNTPTASPTLTHTPTSTITRTATPSFTPSFTPTSTPTATRSHSPTASPSATPTATPSFTPTGTQPSSTASVTRTGTATASVTRSATGTATRTVTGTATSSATGTATPSATGTAPVTVTVTVTDDIRVSETPSETKTVAGTLTETGTVVGSLTSSVTAISTASAHPSGTATPTPSLTPSPSATAALPTPSRTPSPSPLSTSRTTPSFTLSATASATASATPLPGPILKTTDTPSPTFTPTPRGHSHGRRTARLREILGLPNPNPRRLALRLEDGRADVFELRLYSKSMLCVATLRLEGDFSEGWHSAPLPEHWLRLANGTYYLQARVGQGLAWNEGERPGVLVFMP